MTLKYTHNLKSIIKNRLVQVFIVFVFIFMILTLRIYNLQIVNGEQHLSNLRVTTLRTLSIPAQRGSIYDRYGRPLATNKPAFCIKYDPGVVVEDLNTVLIDLLTLLESNGEQYVDNLPISQEEPFTFTFSSTSSEKLWKKDMGLKNEQLDFTAQQTIDFFIDFFKIPTHLSPIEARKLISIRTSIYMQRFRQFNTITIATDVSDKIVAAIEEQNDRFPGMTIDVESLRYYPEGEYFSHILGYIRPISQEELIDFEPYGYTNSDLIGKLGIEKTYELTLNGTKGEESIEVDVGGKRAGVIKTTPSVSGEDVYLTLDSKLQKITSDVLVENLKQMLLEKLSSGQVSLRQLFISMVDSNYISTKNILNSNAGSAQYEIRNIILSSQPNIDIKNESDLKSAKEIFVHAIEQSKITNLQLIQCLIGQNNVTCDTETLQKLNQGQLSPYQFIKQKIISGEIPPSATNIDPSTGSVAVVDVHSGEVLALVTYPSYNNNMLVNQFNNEYYQKLLDDPTTPLINRPLMERKAPGSIFKMLSAITALESNVVNPYTQIQDLGIFTKAGKPDAKCLIYSRYGATHSHVDVSKAIEVSCNYYFYETAYRLGNAIQGNSINSITTFNKYMEKFGLNTYSGVEIEESKPIMASPQTKENAIKSMNSEATSSQTRWMDGDSIRNAIGQSYNSYSAIHMAKYIATLANGTTRYKLTLVKGTRNPNESDLNELPPVVEEEIHINNDNLNSVYKGMLAVTSGSQGTLRNLFTDFPVKVAAKTGTAEESNSRPSHTWFAGFAPYEDPQIAVVVMIPFGESTFNPATKIAKEIILEYLGLNSEPEKSVYNNTLAQ